MSEPMVGKRVELIPQEGDFQRLKPGEYGKWHEDGTWYGDTPNDHGCWLKAHTVVEHEDGTITVSPSILVSDNKGPLWHGFLEHGIWREA